MHNLPETSVSKEGRIFLSIFAGREEKCLFITYRDERIEASWPIFPILKADSDLGNFRRMSGERSLSPSAKPRMERGSGVSVDVGVGADKQGAVNLRGGATFMKSVSIFLMSGRKASVNSNRQTSSSASPKQEPRKRHRRRMPVPATARTSVYTVKLIESLKRKTRFSWRVKIDL